MSGERLQESILDNTNEMKRIDKSNMVEFCNSIAEHYRKSAKETEKIIIEYSKPQNIVVAGMGGSAIGGELVKDYSRAKIRVPVVISRDYQLPEFVNKKTLVIATSYSGETEETLSSFLDAVKRKCMLFCISSGGPLLKYAEKLKIPYLKVQSGMPPRAALPYMLIPQLKCLEKLKLIQPFSDDLERAITILKKVSSENSPKKPVNRNFSKALALKLKNTVPVVYGFGSYRSIALRFKQQFNENSKIPAKWETFSELNHNETMGWEEAKELGNNFAVVILRDKSEPVEIRSRIKVTKELMNKNIDKIFEVWAYGRKQLSKMLSTITIGDFTSYYLVILNNIDPTPVKTVEIMKKKIEQNGVKKKILAELEEISKDIT